MVTGGRARVRTWSERHASYRRVDAPAISRFVPPFAMALVELPTSARLTHARCRVVRD